MRTLSVFAVLACVLALSALASAAVVADADDAALMEIGVDMSSAARLDPTPTYVTTPPAGHDLPTMAKFPLMHEIAGVEAKDWQDIQGLLFREPVVASESSLDMKLDELEAKFNKIDTMPVHVPSPVEPPGQRGSCQHVSSDRATARTLLALITFCASAGCMDATSSCGGHLIALRAGAKQPAEVDLSDRGSAF